MRRKTRRNYDASFKVRVVLEAIKDLKTLAQLGSEFSVHPNQIRNWRNEFLEKASVVFSENQGNEKELKRLEEERDRLHQRIGEQSMDIDFLKKKFKEIEPSMRRQMVQAGSGLSMTRQCGLLSISRGLFYYHSAGLTEMDLKLLEKLDELFTENPTRGTRRLSHALKKRFGLEAGRDKVRGLMRIMGVAAIYPKKNLSLSNESHKKYPYLLRGVEVTRPNHVWSTDITYIRFRNGFIYLTAVIDWYSRYVLSWRLSTMLDRGFCIDALNEALEQYGCPDIFNTDQGSQYTSEDFTGILKSKGIKISMDGKGRALDNVFVERLWRTVKQEEVYLKGYQNVSECREGLSAYFDRYNNIREHQSLDYNYPAEIYFGNILLKAVA